MLIFGRVHGVLSSQRYVVIIKHRRLSTKAGRSTRCAVSALAVHGVALVHHVVVSGVGDSGPLVVYLFGDAAEESPTGTLRWEGGQASPSGPLTARAMEVLRYFALDTLGWDNANIATELRVRSRLEAVIAAVRMGVLTFDDERRGTGGF